ncbi:FAD binding domain-containing protein [Cokeromyces recurvatus]|uniref:FAD binding domain-containing protein n=1 Tax=Cokeromyces recurvatus TaxID=90255 RepID=UPI00221F28B5|nr:FAD binding domain-containing protein [Cokeromyces recurvatus]KAI7900335.1 FAD binding domain-containing protein [Cokeromyces recurvatus]
MVMSDSSIPTPPSKVDFLIVGGGPVGLLAGNLIVQAGFTVRILDIEYEPNHWGRGDWIHGRTLELLERANLETELLKTGVKVEKLSSYMNGKLQKEIPFVPEEIESKHNYLLCVGQHITESSLQSKLSQYDIQVERPTTVVHMDRDENKDSEYPIKATVLNLEEGKGGTEEVRCKYVLGCDGAHSDIRQQLGITNEGETSEIHAGVLDALIRTNFASRKEVCIVQSNFAKTISMFPRENGLTRIFVHFNENEHEQRKEQHNRNKIQLEDIQREAKRALLPHRIEFLGILYWSIYVVGQRYASRIDSEDRRVFLCGDAAHSQSPTLGQGVNTGFGDVFNLIWKICMVERGQLNRKYLSTYHSERWPVAQTVLSIDKMAAKAAAGHQAADYCEVVEKNRLFTAGYGISYEQNSKDEVTLISNSEEDNDDTTDNYCVQPGMRAPNFKVFGYASGKKTRLFDIHNDLKEDSPNWLSFTLFVFALDLRATHDIISSLLNEIHNKTTDLLLPPMHIVIVTTSTADQISTYEKCLLLDKDKIVIDKLNQTQCHRFYYQKQHSSRYHHLENEKVQAILVRPDGYIGRIIRSNDGIMISNKIIHYFSDLL